MMKEDKIFNNSFNTGDSEFEVFGKISLSEEFTSADLYEEFNEKNLQDQIYEIFLASSYYESYSTIKKVPKSEAAEIYYYFDRHLPASDEISSVDKFIAVAEFMNISYDILYKELAPVYKEKILRELDGKYAIFTKRKIKRLF